MKITGKLKDIIKAILEVDSDTVYDVAVEPHKEKRSLNANAYAWVLMDKIARAVKSSKEEIYLRMLEKYGVFYYLPSLPENVEALKKVFRIVYNRGETVLTTPNWKRITCRQLQCYPGSSTYNTTEMSDLIDGIVSEAMELGIETETPDVLERMKQEWNAQ